MPEPSDLTDDQTLGRPAAGLLPDLDDLANHLRAGVFLPRLAAPALWTLADDPLLREAGVRFAGA